MKRYRFWGIVLLLAVALGGFGYEALKYLIINHCVDLGDSGWDSYYGWGIPDFNGTVDISAPTKGVPAEIDPLVVYKDILEEYRVLAENNFDSSLLEQAKYANKGVWNYSGQEKYSVYYRMADLAGDGDLELIISINEKETPYNIIDIFGMENGVPTRIIESDTSVGYRSRYFISTDNRIKTEGSGGALDSVISYYRLLQNSIHLQLEDQYIYNGWDGDTYMHIDSEENSVNISRDEYMYHSSGEDVDFESTWELLHEGHFIHYVE
ncbi:hypothetical protein NXH76_17730 [Blautia schinkii]|nr:hypothetical protein [Blautia schinkii]